MKNSSVIVLLLFFYRCKGLFLDSEKENILKLSHDGKILTSVSVFSLSLSLSLSHTQYTQYMAYCVFVSIDAVMEPG